MGTTGDRVVILYAAFGRGSSIGPPFDQGRTATHEVGHYLGLLHTFTNGCGTTSCYTTADLICDTNPQSTPTTGCPTAYSCSTPDPVDNYMDYSDDLCMKKFTPEQARRMRCTLTHYRPDVFTLVDVVCGDGDVLGDEECDDGGTVPGDGCDENCRYEHTCGDGNLEPGEECDDGNLTPGDGCDENCRLEPECGNAIVEEGEQCDDGNVKSGDGCDADCRIETVGHDCCETGHGLGCNDPEIQSCVCGEDPWCCDVVWDTTCVDEVESFSCGDCNLPACGDNTIDPNEECDDGNTVDGDGCDGNCTLTACGNGVVTKGEQCDDGNVTGGDGCSENCMFEPGNCLPPNVVAGISSRYIQIIPDPNSTAPVAFRIECGSVVEWVEVMGVDYDDGDGAWVNVGMGTPDCANASFLNPDVWTSGGANALYTSGLAVGPGSRPTVTAVCMSCGGLESAPGTPSEATWVYCDSSGDRQVTFFSDLFKQFINTAANGFPQLTGVSPIIEVDTQGDWPALPDLQVTFFDDIFSCFAATTAGGSTKWSGETCP